VVLAHVLACDAAVGVEEIVNTRVRAVAGRAIADLASLVLAVDALSGRDARFDLDYDQVVVLDVAAARASTEAVLVSHCIPADRSADLPRRPAKWPSSGAGKAAAPARGRAKK
jgi:hypothetical protein